MIKKIPALFFLLCFSIASAQTVFKDYVDGELYVKFSGAALKPILREDPNAVPASAFGSLSAVLKRYGVIRISRPFHQADDDALLPCVVKFKFSQAQAVSAFMQELSQAGGIDYVEKVPLMKKDIMPNDPVFPSHLTQINAASAWNVFNGGSNITVAIVDDAVMWNHADLAGNIYVNPGEIPNNGIDDDSNGYIDDVRGYDVTDQDNNPAPTNMAMSHGTHCSGIAGARTDNSTGIASIGWNIKIIPVKCQTDNGSTTNIANGFEGIIYAVRAKARIISCSWGGGAPATTSQAVINYAWSRGCLVLASAGNSGVTTVQYPAGYPNVFCVTSVDNNDIRSSFSNYGSWVDIAAPGSNINSTVPYTGSPAYQLMSGTSMATPLVAGLAGLMLSKCPYMTATDLINCISSTAVNIYSLPGNASYVTGSQLGAGRIDAFQAMNCAAGYLTHAPVANFFASQRIACPNTPVQFSDSSLYAPTGWQWTFQGGTPATSTATNPSVQWSTPGTYSVGLTVTNSSGSDAELKVGYITIAAPVAPPLVEGFQSVTFLPAGWQARNIGNDVIYWQRKTGVGGFGTSNACAMFDNFTYNTAGDRDEMRTPRYNFGNVSTSHLRFDVGYARYDAINSDSLEVRLSTDCGVSWSSIYYKGGTSLATAPDASNQFVPAPSQWRTDSIDISSATAGQGSVMFSFVNHGQYGQPIYVDNINLFFPRPAGGFHGPATICAGSPVTYTNTTVGAASYTWEVAGTTPSLTSVTNPTVSYAVAGTYPVVLMSSNGTEIDTLVDVISVYDYPTASFVVNNPSCTGCSDGSLQVQPQSGSAPYTYTWSPTGGSSAIASNLAIGCYTVTIDAHGCAASATACLSFVTGLPALSSDHELSVYPNPASGSLHVQFREAFSYVLYNSAGQLVLKDRSALPSATLQLGRLPAGIYLLEVNGAQDRLLKKIIIE